MIIVAGPRIPPQSLPSHAGLEVLPYVHNLYRHLAASDLEWRRVVLPRRWS